MGPSVKIGLLTTYLSLEDESDSGIGEHYRVLADTLAAAGHDVRVVHPVPDAKVAQRHLDHLRPRWHCDLVPAPVPAWSRRLLARSWPSQMLVSHLWRARAAGRALNRLPPDRQPAIVETHSYDAPALFLLRHRRRPPVLTRVSTTLAQMAALSPVHSRVRRWEAALERRVILSSDALVTHTAQHRDEVCRMEGYDPARFHLVPHGVVDPGEPSSPPKRADDALEFLFVGRFEHRKGIDVLLEAIPSIAATRSHVNFLLAGSTGDGVAWNNFTAQHPDLVGTRVHSLGRVSRSALHALYRRCDVLVAPSRYESFGLIYVEAMSHGRPVIGCTAGGIPEVVEHGVTGLLAPPGDVHGLTACLESLADDADRRTRMGRAGRQTFLSRFSARALAEHSVEVYARLAAIHPPV